MSLPLFLDAILVTAIVVLIGFLISAVLRLQKTLDSADILVKNLNEQVVPLSSNLINSIERVNSDLTQVEEVVRVVQEVSDRVQMTMEVIREAIASPLVKMASFSAGTREAIKKFMSRA